MTKKLLTMALNTAATVIILWLAASYFDIMAHNMTTCVYWKYNLFTILRGVI